MTGSLRLTATLAASGRRPEQALRALARTLPPGRYGTPALVDDGDVRVVLRLAASDPDLSTPLDAIRRAFGSRGLPARLREVVLEPDA